MPEEALIREIREELGVTIAVHGLIDIVEYDYETFHLHMYCYWATILEGQMKLLEHEAAKWLDRSSLCSVDWLPADRVILNVISDKMTDVAQS